MKSAIVLFCRNSFADPLSAINACGFGETRSFHFGCPEFRSKIGKKRGVEKGQSEPVVEQFDGNEDDGNAEESSERELCTIALCNPSSGKRNVGYLRKNEDMVWQHRDCAKFFFFFCYCYSC